MQRMDVSKLAYMTSDEPGIGGRLKQRPEDFVVEEIPRFELSGRGDYLYLGVEKRRRLTTDVVRILAEHLGIARERFTFAGLKDKHAVTRQLFSIQDPDDDLTDSLQAFDDHGFKILWMDRHHHGLARGAHGGNRFVIRIRKVDASAVVAARRIMERLAAGGAPNFIGEQRFGYRMDNAILGQLLMEARWQEFLDLLLGRPMEGEIERNVAARQAYDRGDYAAALDGWPTVHRFERQALGPLSRGAAARDAINGIDPTQLSLLLSAFQSHVFNHIIDARVRAGRMNVLEIGDVVTIHATDMLRFVEDIETDQPRCDREKISATGPMWGRGMMRARARVGQAELDALHVTGISEEMFGEDQMFRPPGARRPLRSLIADHEIGGGVDEHGPFVRLAFTLGRGCFATVVTREVMKNSGK